MHFLLLLFYANCKFICQTGCISMFPIGGSDAYFVCTQLVEEIEERFPGEDHYGQILSIVSDIVPSEATDAS